MPESICVDTKIHISSFGKDYYFSSEEIKILVRVLNKIYGNNNSWFEESDKWCIRYFAEVKNLPYPSNNIDPSPEPFTTKITKVSITILDKEICLYVEEAKQWLPALNDFLEVDVEERPAISISVANSETYYTEDFQNA